MVRTPQAEPQAGHEGHNAIQARATRGTARTLAAGVALAALVGIVGAGQALAAAAVPDERVLERQRMIDRHRAPGQIDEQGRVALPPRRSGEDGAAAPAETPRRFIRPEPPMGPGPQLDDGQVAPSPARTAPGGARGAWRSSWWSAPCCWRLAPPRPGGSATAARSPSPPPEVLGMDTGRFSQTGSPRPSGDPVWTSRSHRRGSARARATVWSGWVLPHPLLVGAIAAAWAALGLFLLAWQLMVVAMMVAAPSVPVGGSLP